MNINRIYNDVFIETKLNFNSENKNFEIFIFNPTTNFSYKGTFNSKNITIQNSTIENIHTMLSNCLEVKQNYLIEYYFTNNYIKLIYKNEILNIEQNITFDKLNDSSYKINYELALVKDENDKLKQDNNFIKENYVLKESFNQLVRNYESLGEKVYNLTKELDDYKKANIKDNKIPFQSIQPISTCLSKETIFEPIGFIPLGGLNFGPKTINNINNF